MAERPVPETAGYLAAARVGVKSSGPLLPSLLDPGECGPLSGHGLDAARSLLPCSYQ